LTWLVGWWSNVRVLPIIQFNLHFDKKTWEKFKTKVREDYKMTAIEAMRILVDYVIHHGLPPTPPDDKKDGKK